MFQALKRYAAQLLSVGGFRVTQLPRKVYQELLTAFDNILEQPVVFLEPLVNLAKLVPGCLIVDDTSNPKYGLGLWNRTLFIPATKGYRSGYKIVLFLWRWKYGTFPLGFGLWHAQSPKLTDLFLEGVSQLRNHFQLRPEQALFDGAYFSNPIAKRLDDYGWTLVSRFNKGRNLSGMAIKHHIPRGYGQTQGELDNGVKLNVVRRKGYFVAANRMLWSAEKILQTYKARWKVEECFRVLKSCLKLNGCQQHSMRAQALYLCVCLLLCASQAMHLDQSPYSDFQAVTSGKAALETVLSETLVTFTFPV
jgi:Transposase DDE domain